MLYSSTVQIVRRPKRGDGAVSIIDPTGRRLKIPVWMLLPDSAKIKIAEQAYLDKEALLSLASLVCMPREMEDRVHANLLAAVVDTCKVRHLTPSRCDLPRAKFYVICGTIH